MEGRNREVRRLWESQDLTVSRLKRVRYGDIFIPAKVKKGQWEELAQKEVSTLYRMADMPAKDAAAPTPAERKKSKRQDAKRGRVRTPRDERRGRSDKRAGEKPSKYAAKHSVKKNTKASDTSKGKSKDKRKSRKD